MSIKAKYSGRCAGCGYTFSVGALIEKRVDRWGHTNWYAVDCDACRQRYTGLDKDGRGSVDYLTEMLNWFNVGDFLGPGHDNLDLFTLTLRNEFEPWGHASETWEAVWVVTLHVFQEQKFIGKTPEEVIHAATLWIRNKALAIETAQE